MFHKKLLYFPPLLVRGPVERDAKLQRQVNAGQTWTSRSKGAELRGQGTFSQHLARMGLGWGGGADGVVRDPVSDPVQSQT